MLYYLMLCDIVKLEGSDYMSLFIKKYKTKYGKTYCAIVDEYRSNDKIK